MRIASHHLGGGILLGLVTAETGAAAEADLGRTLYAALTSIFQRTVGPEPGSSDQLHSVLLLPEESVMASCFVSGYWTFATSSAAADRMFYDDAKVLDLYRMRAAGEGPADLRVIRGRRMAINVPDVTKEGLVRHLNRLAQRPAHSHREWRALCHEGSDECSATARGLLEVHLDTMDVGHERLVDDICEAVRRKYAPFEMHDAADADLHGRVR